MKERSKKRDKREEKTCLLIEVNFKIIYKNLK